MKKRIPIVRTPFHIAAWFLVRAKSAGNDLTHKKLQHLIYIAYGKFFEINLEKKLIPATFILSKIGPLDPNIYHLHKKVNLEDFGQDLDDSIEDFLNDIWSEFENFSDNELLDKIFKNDVWGEISLNKIGSEIPEKLIIKSFVKNSQYKGEANNIFDDDKEYWTLTGKKAERWIPGISKKNR